MATRRRQGDAASLPFFKKAVEQDPEFALAHARLSTVYSNLGENELAREHIIKAYALKDRVSEPERLYITARYYTTAEPSPQKTIETYQIWNQTYPNDFVPHSNLAVAYQARDEYDKAAEEFRAAIALAPDEPLPRVNLAGVYLNQGKVDEARQTLEDAIKRGLDSASIRIRALRDSRSSATTRPTWRGRSRRCGGFPTPFGCSARRSAWRAIGSAGSHAANWRSSSSRNRRRPG